MTTGTVKDIKSEFVDYLQYVPFFRNFTDEHIQELLGASTIVQVPAGKIIVTEREIDDSFYIILNGKMKGRKLDKVMAEIGAGECFGEMTYISGQPRVATVLADTECIIMKISATLLDKASKGIQLLFFKHFATVMVHRLSKSSVT